MIGFATFVEEVMEKAPTVFQNKCGKVEMKLSKTHKNNKEISSLLVRFENDSNMVPSINLEKLYEAYKEIGDVEKTLETVIERIVEDHGNQVQYIDKINSLKGKVIPQLVNTYANREWLESIPHRPFFDLSVVYRFVFDTNPEQDIISTVINNDFAELLGCNEEQLHERALSEVKDILPPKMFDLNSLASSAGMPVPINDDGEVPPFYVITNQKITYGAPLILLPEVQEELAEVFAPYGGDYFLIPSSVHEMIAVPVADSPEDLLELIRQINFGEIPVEDRLSNSAYRYDSEHKMFSIITNLSIITEE